MKITGLFVRIGAKTVDIANLTQAEREEWLGTISPAMAMQWVGGLAKVIAEVTPDDVRPSAPTADAPPHGAADLSRLRQQIFEEVGTAIASVEADANAHGLTGQMLGARDCLRKVAAIRERYGASGPSQSPSQSPSCDLCGDQGPLVLMSRCHFTAPLRVERNGESLILRCYLPECGREVARFKLAPSSS
jgi:hypothetical protein